jgi:hypothetical protein
LQDVSSSDEIALRIDEERVAEKGVVNAVVAGCLVVRVNDGTDGGAKRGIGNVCRRLLSK